jgi:hypothetical protein
LTVLIPGSLVYVLELRSENEHAADEQIEWIISHHSSRADAVDRAEEIQRLHKPRFANGYRITELLVGDSEAWIPMTCTGPGSGHDEEPEDVEPPDPDLRELPHNYPEPV